MSFLEIFLFILVGSFSGVVAGLLGIGGGVVVVSALVYIFEANFGDSQFLQHTAIGTAFSVMVFTGLVNVFAQSKQRHLDWQVCKKFAPFLVLGVVFGSFVSVGIPQKFLRFLFVLFLYYSSIRMWLSAKKESVERQISKQTFASVGFGIGAFSSWVGIGGGAIMVPFFKWCGLSAHKAIGTSGALTFPVALVGAISYLSAGFSITNPIPHSLGFIYLPCLPILAICTVIFVPFGSKIKAKLSEKTTARLFSAMNLTFAVAMTVKLF